MTGRRASAAAVLAGALAATGQAPFALWWLALAGFALFGWLVVGARTPRSAAWRGWFAGVGYFAVALHWIVEPFLVDIARHGWMAPFALVFLAGGLALFWAGAAALAAWIGGSRPRRALAWAAALATAELLRGHILSGFPWALPAYAWADTPVRLTAAVWGPYGLTLITLLLSALPAFATRTAGVVALSVAALAGCGALAGQGLLRDGADSGTPARVRLVQPNAPQHEKWDPDKALTFVERQIAFTAADKGSEPPDLVIWPETAIPYALGRAGPVLERISDAAEGIPVVLGAQRNAGERWYNSLAVIGPKGQVEEVYDKVRLVPFGEYIPLGAATRFLGLRSFAAQDGYGFSAGAEPRLVDTGALGRALPLICYEAIFPQHPRGLAARPDWLLQITNDAWFGTFSGPYQHLAQAQFRAAEQGLPMVRVANTGISAVIDGRGAITASMPLGEAGFVDTPLPPALAPTPYSRIGDGPLWIGLLALLGALAATGRRKSD